MTPKPMKRENLKELIGITESVINVNYPFNLDDISLPEMGHDEFDLLSDEVVRSLCLVIVDERVNVELAGQAVGIPANTMREYMDTGSADLAAGMVTRKAVVAEYANRAQAAVMIGLLKVIRERPHGFQNVSFILERIFPDHFSQKRTSKKESQQSSQLEALQRQLSGAFSEFQGPRARVKTVGEGAEEDPRPAE